MSKPRKLIRLRDGLAPLPRRDITNALVLAFAAGKVARRENRSPVSPYGNRHLKAAFRRGYAFAWQEAQGLRPIDTVRVKEAP